MICIETSGFVSEAYFYIYGIYLPLKVAVHFKSHKETNIPFFPSQNHGFIVTAANCESWASLILLVGGFSVVFL